MAKDYLENAVWTDKKRTIFGLPLSFTRYILKEDRFFIRKGFLNITEDEIRLYRITDVTMSATLGQRIFGVGTLVCDSSDKSAKKFEIKNIKKARDVKELISEYVENERDRKRVSMRETTLHQDYDDDDFDAGLDDDH